MSPRPVQELLSGTAVVRPRFQITVPPDIVAALDVVPGDTLRFAARSDGYVTVELLRLHPVATPLSEAVASATPLRVVPKPEPVQW
jgi:bifunctional DNA-binding transcriptional regulator/antitoxin component of YhaV-PrlF toxin-antitoxin module